MYEILVEGGWLAVSYHVWRGFAGPRLLNGQPFSGPVRVEN